MQNIGYNQAVDNLKAITLFDLLESCKASCGDKVHKQREGLAILVSCLFAMAIPKDKETLTKLVTSLMAYEPSIEFKIHLARFAMEITQKDE